MEALKKNDIVTLEISAISSDGFGIGKIDGFCIFVPMTDIGEVVEVLGKPNQIETEVKAIIRSYNLFETFPSKVVEAAQKLPQEIEYSSSLHCIVGSNHSSILYIVVCIC